MLFCVGDVVLCDIPTCLITCRKYGGSLARNARFAAPTCLESLVSLWSRRVYGGSCKTVSRLEVLLFLCLWGKLQNLACFAGPTSPRLCGKLQNLSLGFSFGVAVSMGEAAKHCSFCCTHVAVSYVGSYKPQSLACPLASPCLWGKLQNIARFAALTSPCVYGGSCKTSVSTCPLASPCL